jgi:hypothetical protein
MTLFTALKPNLLAEVPGQLLCGRASSLREIIAAGVFLASADASFITAAVLRIDGGATVYGGAFRGNGNAHMHIVRHPVPSDDLAFLLPCQGMKDFSELPTRLTKEHFASSFGNEYHMVFAVPSRMG